MLKKNNKRCKDLKEKAGITLISLVVTIIVLLILAGVSIAMLTGENGILTQARRAKEETEQAKKDEMSDLDSIEFLINEYTGDVNIPQVTDEKPGELEKENETTFVINSIEDLVVFSHNVRNGNKYEGQTVKLGVNLDFKSDKSYVDPDRTDYGIYGYEGNLKQLLTTGEGFIPIGDQEGTNSFYGTFDGDNNVICSLYENIDRNEDIRGGLFAVNYGETKSLGLIDININARGVLTIVGGITGKSYNNIYNCYVTGDIKVTGSFWMPVGGLCGTMSKKANIENCYNLADIESENIKEGYGDADIGCGGIVGQGYANINRCYNKGNINVNGGENRVAVGGICGHLDDGYIKNSYNNGRVEASSEQTKGECYIGGIVGASEVNEILNCYNSGEIIVDMYGTRMGGIVGDQRANGTIDNVFNIRQNSK